ncbi:Nucleotide-binding alpha-beta plait [Penicillium cosmopolitanum]|uniref:Nucleotide-binding alpha-beta plait n=1 Tax=Penicillium cosmopolitanum TaxID=1131564 RepID=A0A9W9W8K4_9EURO|nr:Nucleotide-binding alpha-beta plait [Penicillium cosmopolitanum]KAJ5408233.1 Nucleotide-binding alpha-beta plait [Penicillium cosmopolitanum]
MGDVSSGTINPIRGADGVPPASEPDVSRRTSTPGNTKASQLAQPAPTPISYPSSPSGFPPHGRYASPQSSMNMANMAYALPGHQSTGSPFEQQHHMHHYPATHAQGMMYPMQSMGHFPGQPPRWCCPLWCSLHSKLSSIRHASTPGYHSTRRPLPSVRLQPIDAEYGWAFPFLWAGVPYGPGALPVPTPMRQPPRQGSASGSRGSSSTSPSKRDVDKQTAEEYDVSKTIVDGSNPMKLAAGSNASDATPLAYTAPSSTNPPRGPPRKPKQSGHALWVGNLPPGASVIDLKDHFSQDATDDIESVFLISKSNCAFVNYKSAPACLDALARFHDSRFHGVRLVCRLRKGFTAPGSGSIGVGGPGSRLQNEETPDPPSGGEGIATEPETGPGPLPSTQDDNARSIDRYFIVKSLTVDDLELSKQSGIWATQTHNEISLNQAFETTEHVYLIFSANKSGEYFGYARMLSPISDDEDLALQIPIRPEPTPGTTPAPEELEMTLTPATSNAPKGRIIDDSARGTIFWEVESLEDETDDARSERSVEGLSLEDGEAEGQSFGKPFRIQWLSTERVPFHRTRGLRNPWNANREVKIARDGTEIEPTVGRKLIQLFHLPSGSHS